MKFSRSLLAVSLSAAMLFSVPVSGIIGMEPQTVEAATKSCKLNRSSVTMNVSDSTRLTLSNAVSGKIVWRSSNTKIAVVTNGTVKGIKTGSTYIYAVYGGRTYKFRVTIKEARTPVLNKTSLILNKDDRYCLSLKNTSGKVTWKTSNPSVASVENGNVYAKGKGTAIITARYGGKNYTCRVTVNAADVELNNETADVRIGKSLQLKLKNASGPVVWKSEDPNVATVSSNGKVTGRKKGFVYITAKYKGKTYVCKVYVVKNSKRIVGTCEVTYYCECDICSEGLVNSQGKPIGSTGEVLKANYSIAVDPSVIPLGSDVLIGNRVYKAVDTGGAIKGKRIDVYLGSTPSAHKLTERMGLRNYPVVVLN